MKIDEMRRVLGMITFVDPIYMKDIVNTYDWLNDFIDEHEAETYEELKQALGDYSKHDKSVEIVNDNEDEGFFDVDIGQMTFTIYKGNDEDDKGFRINENATYYTYITGSSIDCEQIDVEL